MKAPRIGGFGMPEPEVETRTPLLEINNLTVEFDTDHGPVRAVNKLNLKLYKGETLGIVGESGSGKSVTSLSLLRLVPNPPGRVVEGEIIFQSKKGRVNILELDKDELQELRGGDISMIFQNPMSSLNPVHTVGAQVIETMLLHQKMSSIEAKKRTIELFDRVHLPNPELLINKYPHQLSGGQKQRVMIAMALSCQPIILIADEPTTALDVTVQKTILELMQELREAQDTSTIFITHDLGVIAEVADRIMVMYQGNKVEEERVWDLFQNPRHPYTKGLLACRPRLDLKLKVLPVVDDFMGSGKNLLEAKSKNARFSSVGQAIMLSYQDEDMRERYETLIKQEPILEVRNLKTYFNHKKPLFGRKKPDIKAVDDVTFNVYPGETLGLVGESGCGKTTLGRSLLRLVEPTSGSVIFEGQDLTKLRPGNMRSLRRNMQIIFQDPYSSLNPRISIGETIMEPMRVHGVGTSDRDRKEEVIDLLETVGLNASHFGRFPHEFSGGQRQRICIARTLALKPRFIICDESVSALDVSVQAKVLNLLNTLKDKFNLTYIFVSHDLAVVKFIADRIMVMNKGKIEEISYSEDVYEKPQSAYTQKLIDSIPKGDLEDIRKAMLKRRLAKQ
jgi:peptide/nickel transport system ATP-binding protein